jgi:hypothetical protein
MNIFFCYQTAVALVAGCLGYIKTHTAAFTV